MWGGEGEKLPQECGAKSCHTLPIPRNFRNTQMLESWRLLHHDTVGHGDVIVIGLSSIPEGHSLLCRHLTSCYVSEHHQLADSDTHSLAARNKRKFASS
mmetsp:Transcript_2594/g.9918  ORF Transcript_2594/g.9918 Transcript_2594/m.9918 type:complete len:99 (+) Transcript_2594:968-1264(+)